MTGPSVQRAHHLDLPPPPSPSAQGWSTERPPTLLKPPRFPIDSLPEWRRPLVLGIVVVAALADVAVRLPEASLAATLTVWAAVVLLATARRFTTLGQWSGAVLLVANGSVLSIRDSPWPASMSIAASMALIVLLAGDGLVLGQVTPWARSVREAVVSCFDTVPWLSKGLVGLGGGVVTGRPLGTGIRAALSAGTVVVVLATLLASGDAAFSWLLSMFDITSWLGHLLLIVCFVVPISALILLTERAKPIRRDAAEGASAPETARYGVESLTAMWAVAGTLLVWCGLQVALVGGGARSVLAEQGLTAAEYARRGFFQLVAVAAISLAVMNLAHRLARTERGPARAQRLPAVLIGGALAVLTVVSFSRLGYYVASFGLTMLRLSVATFLGWLALMTGLSVARSLGLHVDRNWLPSAAVLSAALFAATFGAANPERWVAHINLERATVEDPVDVVYLTSSLGPDAKGTVADYAWSRLGGMPASIRGWLCAEPTDVGYGPLGWNMARASQPGVDCLP